MSHDKVILQVQCLDQQHQSHLRDCEKHARPTKSEIRGKQKSVLTSISGDFETVEG